jgi:hypothetical protein
MSGSPRICLTGIGALALAAVSSARPVDEYTLVNLGKPEGAYQAIGVRMNNFEHVAGSSQFFGEIPVLRAWVWTPEEGFTILPVLPQLFGSRAIDISDSGIVAGDGGFDVGPAWRFENGEYEIVGPFDGLPIGITGGVNEAGDVAGWFKDNQLQTPDKAFLSINGGEVFDIIPEFGSRATDLNDNGQVCGYTGGQQAFRWSEATGVEFLGALDLSRSFATRMNEAGSVVGYAISANGNTSKAWIFTDVGGQQPIPGIFENSSAAISINEHEQVVGISEAGGPEKPWLWTEEDGVSPFTELFDFATANMQPLGVSDINDDGVILMRVYDNNVADFRSVLLVPKGACAADFNGDGSLDILDFVAFQAAFVVGDDNADCDGNGALTVLDFVCFQGEFQGGCP